jgi:chromosome segregation ATPase
MSDFQHLVSELQNELTDKLAMVKGAEQRISALKTIEADLRSRCAQLQASLADLEPAHQQMLGDIKRLHEWIDGH